MIDEYFRKQAPKFRRATKRGTKGMGNAIYHSISQFSAWFDDFRWIEFCTAITAATAVGLTMAGSFHLSDDIAKKIGAFGGIVTAIAFVRSPKTKWHREKEEFDADAEDEE